MIISIQLKWSFMTFLLTFGVTFYKYINIFCTYILLTSFFYPDKVTGFKSKSMEIPLIELPGLMESLQPQSWEHMRTTRENNSLKIYYSHYKAWLKHVIKSRLIFTAKYLSN